MFLFVIEAQRRTHCQGEKSIYMSMGLTWFATPHIYFTIQLMTFDWSFLVEIFLNNRIRDGQEFSYKEFVDHFYNADRAIIDTYYVTVLDSLIAEQCRISEYAIKLRSEFAERHNPDSEHHAAYMAYWENRYVCERKLATLSSANSWNTSVEKHFTNGLAQDGDAFIINTECMKVQK
ncbi:hypothetical protein BD408DRAFT_266153 [Parasitella parasitica]|nr:hypothetical protein BD408DRAFT_266153 [Parasitella parasitica]